MKKLTFLVLFWLLCFWGRAHTLPAKTVEYDLYIAKQEVNITGSNVEAMTVNGSIPGPTVEFTEGDLALIRVHNKMDVETSIHWHGILLPNREDGVPYLTTVPIKPHFTHLFQFPLIQSGTYWYHSHTGLQEQRGVYGSIVIHPRKETVQADRDYVVVLSDWTDENPDEVLRTLKRGSDYYALKKGSVQSIWGAFKANALMDVFQRSLQMMPPMDISDVGYDAFLINGTKQKMFAAKPGETIRLRIINAAASSYFYLQFAGGPMQIISADGLNVDSVKTDRLLIAVAETYDVLVTIPQGGKSFEFRATAQDGSGFASAFLGTGHRVNAADVEKPDLYRMMHGDMAMDHGAMDMEHDSTKMNQETMQQIEVKHEMPGMQPKSMSGMDKAAQSHASMNMGSSQNKMAKMNDSSMEHSDMGHSMQKRVQSVEVMQSESRPMPPYNMLRSVGKTALAPENPLREIKLVLTGDMERYVWSFNGKILTEADKLLIKRGENVRITFINTTMMHHPLHLHGHFFRVVNGQGDTAPLKHTVDIAPMATQVIEFYANEEKDWLLHCHILYHMKTGMSRVVSYQGSPVDSDIAEAREQQNFLNHDSWYAWGEAHILSNMTEGELVAANTRSSFTMEWEKDWNKNEYEVMVTYGHYFNRFFTAFSGFNVTDEFFRGVAGFRTISPLLIDIEARVDTEGEGRINFDKSLQLNDHLSVYGESQYDTESKWDWLGGLEWTINKNVSAVLQYHSEYDAGIGVQVRF